MGIEVRIQPQDGMENIKLRYTGITPEMNVTREDPVQNGHVIWNSDKKRNIQLYIEAGADRSTPIPADGGYARIGSNLYFVNTSGPQSIEISIAPLHISLTATTK